LAAARGGERSAGSEDMRRWIRNGGKCLSCIEYCIANVIEWCIGGQRAVSHRRCPKYWAFSTCPDLHIFTYSPMFIDMTRFSIIREIYILMIDLAILLLGDNMAGDNFQEFFSYLYIVGCSCLYIYLALLLAGAVIPSKPLKSIS